MIPAPDYSHDGLALLFADKHATDLRYVAASKKMVGMDGTRWTTDSTRLAFEYARIVCRDAARDCGDARLRVTLSSAATVASVERLARSDRRLAATLDEIKCLGAQS